MAHNEAAHKLRALIKSGVFKVGDKLPSYKILASAGWDAENKEAALGSFADVRRAATLLAREKLLVIRPRSGVYVLDNNTSSTEIAREFRAAFRQTLNDLTNEPQFVHLKLRDNWFAIYGDQKSGKYRCDQVVALDEFLKARVKKGLQTRIDILVSALNDTYSYVNRIFFRTDVPDKSGLDHLSEPMEDIARRASHMALEVWMTHRELAEFSSAHPDTVTWKVAYGWLSSPLLMVTRPNDRILHGFYPVHQSSYLSPCYIVAPLGSMAETLENEFTAMWSHGRTGGEVKNPYKNADEWCLEIIVQIGTQKKEIL